MTQPGCFQLTCRSGLAVVALFAQLLLRPLPPPVVSTSNAPLAPAALLKRVPGEAATSLLRFAELQDELVGVTANRLVEHFGRAGVRRIGENRTLGVELESRGFDLSAHGRGLDAM